MKCVPRGTGLPALAADEVTDVVAPADGVATAVAVRVGRVGLTISPPRVVVSTVGSAAFEIVGDGLVGGQSENAGRGSEGSDDDGLEGNHCEETGSAID